MSRSQIVILRVTKIPISAFVLHDMLEHVQSHATYRFVLSDDEDERPRLLVGSYSMIPYGESNCYDTDLVV